MWPVLLLVIVVGGIIVMTARWKVHPFLALIVAAFGYGLLCGKLSPGRVVEAVNLGFGTTVGNIGIVILAGSIIGTFLEKSGGALRLAELVLRLTGPRRVPLAMSILGGIVSIPVFCDSGFVILAPLTRALAKRARLPLAAAAIALSLGLLATHSMVPPTPGPLAAAESLQADLGLTIVFGLAVSVVAIAAGWAFSVTAAVRSTPNDVTPEANRPEHAAETPEPDEFGSAFGPDQDVEVETQKLPAAWKAAMPILLPLALIVLRSASLVLDLFGEGVPKTIVEFLGQPVVALSGGVLVSLLLPKRLSFELLSTGGWVGSAINGVTSIIIITGAGGAFGKILQESGIAGNLQDQLAGAHLGIWLPMVIAAALKSAQGSGTVAIITTAAFMSPLLGTMGLDAPIARALVVTAIGAGGMIASHANDSYFWVVTQLSGLKVGQGYRLQTLGSAFEGTVACLTVWVISLVVL